MVNRLLTALMLASLSLLPFSAKAGGQRLGADDIDIEFVDGHYGRSLPQYPVEGSARTYRGYLEATPGAKYSIRVRNRTDRRVGLVIAVDGRNIISGKRSDLHRDERMYVLGPYEQAEYSGWRTGRNEVNRFYFTDAPDSYAGRWGDYSAIGVIALAAYVERRPAHFEDQLGYRRVPSGEPDSRRGTVAPRHGVTPVQPGTGFGEEAWSPSRRVAFEAGRKPFARYFIKYEWPDNLCRMGIGDCRRGGYGRHPGHRRDDNRFAPPPPGYDEKWYR